MGHLSFNESVRAINGGRRPAISGTQMLGALGGKKSRRRLAGQLAQALQDQKRITELMQEMEGINQTVSRRLGALKAMVARAESAVGGAPDPETAVMVQTLKDSLFDAEAAAKKSSSAYDTMRKKYDTARTAKSMWGPQYWVIVETGLSADSIEFRGQFESAMATMKDAAKKLTEYSRTATSAAARAESTAREAAQRIAQQKAAALAEQRAAEEAERQRAEASRAAEEAKYARERERQERQDRLRQEELSLQQQLREEERALREAEIAERQSRTQASEAAEQRRVEAELRREEMQMQFQQQQMEWQRQQAERQAEREAAREDREAAREALMLQLELAREGLAPSPFGPPAGAMPAMPGMPGMPGMAPGFGPAAYPGMPMPGQFPGMPGMPGMIPGAMPGAGLSPYGVSVPPQPGAFTPAPGPGAPMPQVAPPSFMPPYQQSTGIQAAAGMPGGFFQPASFSPGSELFGMGNADARVTNTTGSRSRLAGAQIKSGYKLHGPSNGRYIMERPDGSRFEVPSALVEAGATQPITEDDGTVIYEPPTVSGGYHQQQGSGLSPATTAAIRDIAVAAAQSATSVITAREQRKLEEARLKHGGGLPSLSFSASENVQAGGGSTGWLVPLGLAAVGVGLFAALRKKKK